MKIKSSLLMRITIVLSDSGEQNLAGSRNL